MATAARLRQDLATTRSLGDIIDVLKTAALIQFRIFQSKPVKPQEDFAGEISRAFEIVLSQGKGHPYLYDRKSMPSQIVIITSDEGFLGELNTLLINTGAELVKSQKDEIVVIGERGARYLEDMGLRFTYFPGFTDEVRQKEIDDLRTQLINGYRGKFGRISVVYPKFLSLTSRRIEVLNLLPYAGNTASLSGAASGKYMIQELLLEPSLRAVLEEMVFLWIGYQLTQICWTAKLAEYSARIMHLESSTQELSNLNQKLGMVFFKHVHALKDKSIREITASKIMLDRK